MEYLRHSGGLNSFSVARRLDHVIDHVRADSDLVGDSAIARRLWELSEALVAVAEEEGGVAVAATVTTGGDSRDSSSS